MRERIINLLDAGSINQMKIGFISAIIVKELPMPCSFVKG
jgi:hypothetical protein